MKHDIRKAAMALATQAESLPKLRDKLLGIVDEINHVLNDGRPNDPSVVHGLAVDPSWRRRVQGAASTVTGPHPSSSSGPWISLASPPTTTVISSGRIQQRAASWASLSVTLRIRSR